MLVLSVRPLFASSSARSLPHAEPGHYPPIIRQTFSTRPSYMGNDPLARPKLPGAHTQLTVVFINALSGCLMP